MYTVEQARSMVSSGDGPALDMQLLDGYQCYWDPEYTLMEDTANQTLADTTITQFLSLTYHLAKTFKHGFFVATVLTDLMKRFYGASDEQVRTLVERYITNGWLIPVNTMAGCAIEEMQESSVYAISLKGRTARTSADHELLHMFVVLYNSLCRSNLVSNYTSKGGVLFSQTCELSAVQHWIATHTVLSEQDDIATVIRDLRNEGYVSEILDDPQRLFITPCGRHVVERASRNKMTPRILAKHSSSEGGHEEHLASALKKSVEEDSTDTESVSHSGDLAQMIQTIQADPSPPRPPVVLQMPQAGPEDGAFPGIRVRQEDSAFPGVRVRDSPVQDKGGVRRFSLNLRRAKKDTLPGSQSGKLSRRSLKSPRLRDSQDLVQSPNTLGKPTKREKSPRTPRTPRTPKGGRAGTISSRSPRPNRTMLSKIIPRRISSATVEDTPNVQLIQIRVQPMRLYDPSDFPLGARQLNFHVIDEIEMARQITLMMQEAYSGLKQQDFSKLRRDLPGTPLQSLISLANDVSLWCVSEILCAPREMLKRSEVQEKFVKLANALLELHNYGATIPILLGLQMGCIERLQIPMSAPVQEMYDAMKPLSDPSKSFLNYRAELARVSSEQTPCIVHILVTLQDLIFIEEGNPTMISNDPKNSTPAAPVAIADLPLPPPAVLGDFGDPVNIPLSHSAIKALPLPPPPILNPASKYINIDKLELLDNAIKSALQFQSYSYKLAEVPEIQQWYRTGRVILQDKHFFAQSYKIKPPT